MLKNVAGQDIGAQMITAADGTAFTGSVTVSVTGESGTPATGSVGPGACAHEGNGYHSYLPAQAETNYDHVAFTFTGTGAIPVTIQVYTDAAYDRVGAAGAGLTAVPWNSSWDTEVESEVNDALVALNLDHVAAVAATGADVADNSIVAQMVSSAATADWDTYVNTTDSFQALRDRGDAAWTTGGGGSISDIISWQPLIPQAIDLANTATFQIAIAVTNMLDDLPSGVEMTPGTISIDRKAQGGTSWTSVVSDAAMSEIAGLIYYDEVFDTATGYQSGDVLRFTFKNQTVTVSANDYEIFGSTGGIFYSAIIADTPDVNLAQIGGSATNIARFDTFLATLNGSGQIQAGTLATDAISSAKIADGTLTSAKFGSAFLTAEKIGADAFTAAKFAADVTTEIQSGLATSAEIAALDVVVDRVESDTQDIQSRLPASLNNGAIVADIQRINDVALTGDGSGTPFTV